MVHKDHLGFYTTEIDDNREYIAPSKVCTGVRSLNGVFTITSPRISDEVYKTKSFCESKATREDVLGILDYMNFNMLLKIHV